ncbi:hypothetical protein ACOME3_005107 [Neoechinorhynchus agilis]
MPLIQRKSVTQVFPPKNGDFPKSRHDQKNDEPAVHAGFLDFQKSIKDNQSAFYADDEFLKHLELGKEFDKGAQYYSRQKARDNVGFEYSIPPKERTLNARVRNTYLKWIEHEKMLEDEENHAIQVMEGNEVPTSLRYLQYEKVEDEGADYDVYYKEIQRLSKAEKRYEDKLNNTADSALITGGDVAYGRAVKRGDSDVEFERKVSTSSLGDVNTTWEVDQGLSIRSLAKVVKKTMRLKKNKQNNEKHNSLEENGKESEDDAQFDSQPSASGSLRGFRNLVGAAKDRYRSLRDWIPESGY